MDWNGNGNSDWQDGYTDYKMSGEGGRGSKIGCNWTLWLPILFLVGLVSGEIPSSIPLMLVGLICVVVVVRYILTH